MRIITSNIIITCAFCLMLSSCYKKQQIKNESIIKNTDYFVTTKSFYENKAYLDKNLPKEIDTAYTEIFIGEEYSEGSELINYLWEMTKPLKEDSLIQFSLYQDKIKLVYSVSELFRYEDVKEYKVLDTLIFSKKKKPTIYFLKAPTLGKEIIIDSTNNYKIRYKDRKFIRIPF